MGDFLTRLAERTLEVVPAAQPIIAPMFAQGPTMVSTLSEGEAFAVQNEEEATPITPTQATRRPIQPAQSPLLRANQPSQVPVIPEQPARQTSARQVVPQPQYHSKPHHAESPHYTEPSYHAEPPHNTEPQHNAEPSHNAELPRNTELQHRAEPSHNTEPPHYTVVHPMGHVETEHPQAMPRESMILAVDATSREKYPNAAIQHTVFTNEPLVNASSVGEPQIYQQVNPAPAAPIDSTTEHIIQLDRSTITSGEILQHGLPGRTSFRDISVDSSPSLEPQTSWSGEEQSPATIPSQRQLVGLDIVREQEPHTPASKRAGLPEEQQQLLVPHVQQQQAMQQTQGVTTRQQTNPTLANRDTINASGHQPQITTSLTNQSATSQHVAMPAAEEALSTPTIRVTIGRIDVHAITPPASPPRPKPGRSGPPLSLDDYTKQRKGGER